jgi:hypothetical protein
MRFVLWFLMAHHWWLVLHHGRMRFLTSAPHVKNNGWSTAQTVEHLQLNFAWAVPLAKQYGYRLQHNPSSLMAS